MIEELYEEHEETLKRFAISLSRDDRTADDLVQETFTRALASIDLLRILSPQKRRSWLFTVLRNCQADRWRKQRWEVIPEEDIEIPGDSAMEILPDAVAALSVLPKPLQDTIVKRYWLGMTSSEIARIQGISAATVRFRLSAALRLIQAKLIRKNKEVS